MQVSGRILIDYYGYHKHHEGVERKGKMEGSEENRQQHGSEKKSSEGALYAKCLPKEKQEENIKEMLSRENDLIFVSPMLKGFSLKAKVWCRLFHSSRLRLRYIQSPAKGFEMSFNLAEMRDVEAILCSLDYRSLFH